MKRFQDKDDKLFNTTSQKIKLPKKLHIDINLNTNFINYQASDTILSNQPKSESHLKINQKSHSFKYPNFNKIHQQFSKKMLFPKRVNEVIEKQEPHQIQAFQDSQIVS